MFPASLRLIYPAYLSNSSIFRLMDASLSLMLDGDIFSLVAMPTKDTPFPRISIMARS